MFRLIKLQKALGAFAAGVFTIMALPAFAQSVHIKIGTSNPSSSHYGLAVAYAESVAKGTNDGIIVDVLQTGGSIDNIKLLIREEVSFGIAAGGAQYFAYSGTGSFEGAAYPKLRAMFVYNTTPVIMAVRADSGITSVYDLEGQPFNAGLAGSSTERETRSAFEALGITPKYYSASLDDAINAMKDNRIVGFTKSAASLVNPDASVLDVSSLLDIRVLPLPEPDKVLAHDPTLMIATIPAHVYADQGQTEEMKVFGHTSGYATSTNVDADLIYRAFKAIMENKDMQTAVFKSVGDNHYPTLTAQLASIPIHAGVVRYLREAGIAIPDRLVPPEAN